MLKECALKDKETHAWGNLCSRMCVIWKKKSTCTENYSKHSVNKKQKE